MSAAGKLGRDRVFHLLRNPLRRGIILLLGDRAEVSFSDLRRTFSEISVGTLYYHLDLLHQLVTQNSRKLYVLTEEGRRVYNEILRTDETMIPVKASVSSQAEMGRIDTLLLSKFFANISLRPRKYSIALLMILLSSTLASWLSPSVLLGFFFITVNAVSLPIAATLSGASLLAVFLLIDALSLLLFRRRGGDWALLTATSAGLLPLLVYPVVVIIAGSAGELALFIRSPLNLILRVATLLASILLITGGLSQAKGLTLQRSILISLLTIYGNMLLLLLLGYVQI